MNEEKHIPVLLEEVSDALIFDEKACFIDGTFGAGGYSRFFLEQGAKVIAFDQDPTAIKIGQDLLDYYPKQFSLIEDRFSNMESHVQSMEQTITGIILDIGVSSMQIDEAERGFSFQKDGPLDMRMAQKGFCASDIVNGADLRDLARIFSILGEERFALPIAKMIERERKRIPFTSTLQLAKAIEALVPYYKQGRIHPATRVFQALRIYVNNELQELIDGLFAAERLLAPGGRLVVVSFHSLEDRIVKRFFQNRMNPPNVSRHLPFSMPLEPSFEKVFRHFKKAQEQELHYNKRARSAKLRAGIRTKAPALKADKGLFSLPILPTYQEGT